MKAKEWFKEAERFVRSYTEGMRESEFSRLFERDAARAFDVVTREHDREKEPKDEFWRFLHRVRIFFLGLSFKLSPPRRLLFAICIVLALIGLVGIDIDNFITVRNAIAFSLSIAGLVLLLVLELADRVVVRDELEVARELQRELLPRAAPPVPGYDFAFSYRTANTIGGDYYDFLVLDDGRLVVVMGDASGHGISAGLLMAIANSALKLGFDSDPDPVSVAGLVNRALCRTGGRRAFMTLFCGVLEPETGRLRFVCAGHPTPRGGHRPWRHPAPLHRWRGRNARRRRGVLRFRPPPRGAGAGWIEPDGARSNIGRARSIPRRGTGLRRSQSGGHAPRKPLRLSGQIRC
jgi:hypothetical protein